MTQQSVKICMCEWAMMAGRYVRRCEMDCTEQRMECPPAALHLSQLIAGARDSPVAAANDRNVFKMARSPPAPSARTELKLGQYTHRKVVPIMAKMSDV